MNIYVSRNGEQFGPYTDDIAKSYLAQGALQHDDQACAEGGDVWKPLKDLLGIAPPSSGARDIRPLGRKIKTSSFLGMGALVQLLGLLLAAPVAFLTAMAGLGMDGGFLVGFLFVATMLIAGSRMATKWKCSECRNLLPEKDAKLCPACRCVFTSRR